MHTWSEQLCSALLLPADVYRHVLLLQSIRSGAGHPHPVYFWMWLK